MVINITIVVIYILGKRAKGATPSRVRIPQFVTTRCYPAGRRPRSNYDLGVLRHFKYLPTFFKRMIL